jgi:histone deacetylase 1/2
MADGSGMRILHVGQALLPTPTKSLYLCNVLHVPSVTRNLLSVLKFTHDNNVFY